MNTLMLVALAVVALCYCGGRFCPKVLSSNKEVVLGVLVGMALCSFAGLRLEGFESVADCITTCGTNVAEPCQTFFNSVNSDCELLRERVANLRKGGFPVSQPTLVRLNIDDCDSDCQEFRKMGEGKTPNCDIVPTLGASLTPKLCLPDNLKTNGMDDEEYCGRVPANCKLII